MVVIRRSFLMANTSKIRCLSDGAFHQKQKHTKNVNENECSPSEFLMGTFIRNELFTEVLLFPDGEDLLLLILLFCIMSVCTASSVNGNSYIDVQDILTMECLLAILCQNTTMVAELESPAPTSGNESPLGYGR